MGRIPHGWHRDRSTAHSCSIPRGGVFVREAAQKRMLDRRFGPKNFNVLRPIWRWTQAKFARQSPWRAFVGWQAYYAVYLRTDSTRALIHHTAPYVGTATQQNELIDGMVAGRGPAIVWAPPGCGKSRFALELARRIERAPHRYQVLFVRHDESVVREELPQLARLKS